MGSLVKTYKLLVSSIVLIYILQICITDVHHEGPFD